MVMDPISVLVVDDSPLFLRFVERFLRNCGAGEVFVVSLAGGGREALTQARRLRPEVILLDLHMPAGLSGFQALPLLREALPEAGIIAISMMDVNVYREAALKAGADAFVSKSRLDADLLPAIRAISSVRQSRERGEGMEAGGQTTPLASYPASFSGSEPTLV